jgi:hypothetical protein
MASSAYCDHSNIIALMMGTETVPEMLDFNELTRLSAREDFINFSRRESFTSYIANIDTHLTNVFLHAAKIVKKMHQ